MPSRATSLGRARRCRAARTGDGHGHSGRLVALPVALLSGAPATVALDGAISLRRRWRLVDGGRLADLLPGAAPDDSDRRQHATFVVPAFAIAGLDASSPRPVGVGMLVGFGLILVSLSLVLGIGGRFGCRDRTFRAHQSVPQGLRSAHDGEGAAGRSGAGGPGRSLCRAPAGRCDGDSAVTSFSGRRSSGTLAADAAIFHRRSTPDRRRGTRHGAGPPVRRLINRSWHGPPSTRAALSEAGVVAAYNPGVNRTGRRRANHHADAGSRSRTSAPE